MFHNGDWSGDAYIRPSNAPRDVPDTVVPGFVLKHAARVAVIDDVRNHVEAALDKAFEIP